MRSFFSLLVVYVVEVLCSIIVCKGENSVHLNILNSILSGQRDLQLQMNLMATEIATLKTEIRMELEALKDGQREEYQRCAKQDQMEAFYDNLKADQQEMINSLQNCSIRDQKEDILELLRTDDCVINNCSEMATCKDHILEYTCNCLPGFSGDGFTCQDIDECQIQRCGVNEVCLNIPGSYRCICEDGYTWNGNICHDVNECQEATNNCHENGICTNTPGSYICQCILPYAGDGSWCTRCESPSLYYHDLGCVTIIEKFTKGYEAQAKCNAIGARLLEGLTRLDQIETLSQDLGSLGDYGAWIGLRNMQWMSSKEPVSSNSQLWMKDEPDEGEDECATVSLYRPYGIGLVDDSCSKVTYVLCQKVKPE